MAAKTEVAENNENNTEVFTPERIAVLNANMTAIWDKKEQKYLKKINLTSFLFSVYRLVSSVPR